MGSDGMERSEWRRDPMEMKMEGQDLLSGEARPASGGGDGAL
jgi:hypothetical protein